MTKSTKITSRISVQVLKFNRAVGPTNKDDSGARHAVRFGAKLVLGQSLVDYRAVKSLRGGVIAAVWSGSLLMISVGKLDEL